MSERKADAVVDITGVVCPITFVKVKVALEELDDGQILEIRMNAGEPILNIPRSLKEEGHRVLEVEPAGESIYTVWVEKGGLQC
jgi:TusA-related sulfurtransferase